MFLMLALSVYNHIVPGCRLCGYFLQGLGEHLKYLFVPASIAWNCTGSISHKNDHVLRCLDVLYKNFIHTARAKGLKEKKVLLVYGLKNAAPVILTAVGQSFGSLITGTIVTETIVQYSGAWYA